MAPEETPVDCLSGVALTWVLSIAILLIMKQPTVLDLQ